MWDHLQSPGGVLLTFVLLHFVWQALLVYCLGRMGATLLPLGSANARYRWALGTMGAMLLCPLVTLVLLEGREMPLPLASTVLPDSAAATVSSAGIGAVAPSSFEANVAAGLLLSLQPYLMLGWIGGVLVLALRLGLGYGGTVWLRRVGLTPVDAPVRVRFVQISDALGLSLVPGVAFSRQVSQAMTVGLLRPMVLLPASWLTQLTPEILEAVVAHELAHVRRQDLWVNILQRIAETLFFYHPAVWWISSEIRRERELCCDELAIEATGKRLAYARSLEQVAHWQEGAPALLGISFLGGRQEMLLGRIQRILGLVAPDAPHRFSPACLLLIATGMGLAMAGLTVLPAVSAQAQPNAPRQSAASLALDQPSTVPPAEAASPALAETIEESDVVLMESILDLHEEVRRLQRQIDHLRRAHRPPPPHGQPPHGQPHGPPPHGPPPHDRPPRDGRRPPPPPRGGPPADHAPFPPPHADRW